MTETPRTMRAALAAILLLVGCGGSTALDDADSGGAGSSSGGSSSGGAAQGGSSQGGAGDCSQFADDNGWSVAVLIRNQTSETLHLGAQQVDCSTPPLFHVQDAATGNDLAEFGACRSPCDLVMQGGPVGCPALCALPSAVTLQPGEGTSVVWSGLYPVQHTLPDECLPAGETQPLQCDRATQISAGAFTFTAQAGTELDCSQGPGPCGQCMPTGAGGCTTGAAVIAGTLRTAETTVDLDASYGVGGDNVAADVAVGPTIPVEIVFSD